MFAATAFGATTLLPVPLLALGAIYGGPMVWIALAYLTIFAFAMDELIAVTSNPDEAEFPAADGLSVLLALSHFGLLALTVAALGRGWVQGLESAALFIAAGLFFGQVSNSNAHELIHRSGRVLRGLGRWVFISLLFGHHASAHPKVHHRYVGSDRDPNSAKAGQSFYRFAPRAWRGSFRAGLKAENKQRRGRAQGIHPYAIYFLGAGAMLGMAVWIGGWTGLAAFLGLAVYAQSQLLLSDYVQHYGLRRAVGADGRLEPVSDRHSWNAPHWFSSHLMLNAPRHSEHHAHPARPFPDLALPRAQSVPMLPYSLQVMSIVALMPTLWRRMMDKRVADWTVSGVTRKAA